MASFVFMGRRSGIFSHFGWGWPNMCCQFQGSTSFFRLGSPTPWCPTAGRGNAGQSPSTWWLFQASPICPPTLIKATDVDPHSNLPMFHCPRNDKQRRAFNRIARQHITSLNHAEKEEKHPLTTEHGSQAQWNDDSQKLINPFSHTILKTTWQLLEGDRNIKDHQAKTWRLRLEYLISYL